MNFSHTSSPRGPLDALRRLPMVLLRVVLGLVGLVFALGLVMIGLAAGSALVASALLRGRRPQGLRFDIRRRGATSRAEVIDIEARDISEVSDPPVRP